jgi:hypothetical protein
MRPSASIPDTNLRVTSEGRLLVRWMAERHRMVEEYQRRPLAGERLTGTDRAWGWLTPGYAFTIVCFLPPCFLWEAFFDFLDLPRWALILCFFAMVFLLCSDLKTKGPKPF